MGWQDREYARGASPFRPGWVGGQGRALGGLSIVTTLLIANAAVFMLCSMTGGRDGVIESPIFQWTALHTPAVLKGQMWRLITAQYLHWNFWHIFMNMLGLYFLGPPLEREWGRRKFFAVYTAAGLLGNIFYVALTLIGWLSTNGVLAGASGCVLALLGACAVRYPNAQVLVYFVFPIKIRTAAILFGAWYVLNLFTRGDNAGGDACHLAGLGFGVWWAMRGDAWWARAGGRIHTRRPGGRSTRPGRPKPSSSFAKKVEQRRHDAETVDRILRKVYEGGIHSLTDAEKQTLKAATERQREAETGRVDRL